MKYRLISAVAISTLLMSSMVFASSEVVEPTEEVVVVEEGVEPYASTILVNNERASGVGTYYSKTFKTQKTDLYINYDYTNNGAYPTTMELVEKTGINSYTPVPNTQVVVQPGSQKSGTYAGIDPNEEYSIAVYNQNASTYPVSGIIRVVSYNS